MPWTVKDVPRFKKGLTPAQKKKWVKIANGALESCQKKGGKNCEASAIKIANSKFSNDKENIMGAKSLVKVPKGALRFVESGENLNALAVGDKGEKPRLQMVAYTGKLIKGHWWWGDLAIDVEGMKIPAGKFPILENHNTDRKIAFTSNPIFEGFQLNINPDKTQFVETEFVDEFIKLSQEGFPYQSSIYAKPTEIQRLGDKEVAEVNGMKLKGPGVTIWRKCELKEASVCVFGWDSKTKSSAFSKDEMEEIEVEGGDQFTEETDVIETQLENKEGGDEEMNLEELKSKHPELVTALTEEVTASVTESLEAKFTAEREKFQKNEDALQDRVNHLEKKDALRADRENRVQADRIWDQKLAESDVLDIFYDKAKRMVRYSKFVKNDVFDVETFSSAVDEEIKDWVDRGATSEVQGTGFTRREVDDKGDADAQALSDENKTNTNMLLNRAGQKTDS